VWREVGTKKKWNSHCASNMPLTFLRSRKGEDERRFGELAVKKELSWRKGVTERCRRIPPLKGIAFKEIDIGAYRGGGGFIRRPGDSSALKKKRGFLVQQGEKKEEQTDLGAS